MFRRLGGACGPHLAVILSCNYVFLWHHHVQLHVTQGRNIFLFGRTSSRNTVRVGQPNGSFLTIWFLICGTKTCHRTIGPRHRIGRDYPITRLGAFERVGRTWGFLTRVGQVTFTLLVGRVKVQLRLIGHSGNIAHGQVVFSCGGVQQDHGGFLGRRVTFLGRLYWGLQVVFKGMGCTGFTTTIYGVVCGLTDLHFTRSGVVFVHIVFVRRVRGNVGNGKVVLTKGHGLQHSFFTLTGVVFRGVDLLGRVTHGQGRFFTLTHCNGTFI